MPIERKRQTCLPNHIVALARTTNGVIISYEEKVLLVLKYGRLGSSTYNSDIKETQTQRYCQF